MKYKNLHVDARGLATTCPNCNNEEVLASHCHICGYYLINKCSGYNINELDDPFSEYVNWGKNDKGCENTLPGNARFCSNCGCTSTFHEQGFFEKTWQDEKALEEDKLPF